MPSSVTVPAKLSLVSVTAAAVAGSMLGARLTGRVPHARLRTGFGWFVVAMAGFVLIGQQPHTTRHALLTTPTGMAAAGMAAAVTAVAVARTRHSADAGAADRLPDPVAHNRD